MDVLSAAVKQRAGKTLRVQHHWDFDDEDDGSATTLGNGGANDEEEEDEVSVDLLDGDTPAEDPVPASLKPEPPQRGRQCKRSGSSAPSPPRCRPLTRCPSMTLWVGGI